MKFYSCFAWLALGALSLAGEMVSGPIRVEMPEAWETSTPQPGVIVAKHPEKNIALAVSYLGPEGRPDSTFEIRGDGFIAGLKDSGFSIDSDEMESPSIPIYRVLKGGVERPAGKVYLRVWLRDFVNSSAAVALSGSEPLTDFVGTARAVLESVRIPGAAGESPSRGAEADGKPESSMLGTGRMIGYALLGLLGVGIVVWLLQKK